MELQHMTEDEILPATSLLEHNVKFLQCASMIIDAVMDARHFAKNSKLTKNSISIH